MIDAIVVKSFAKVFSTNAKIVKAAAILDQPFGRLSRGAKAGLTWAVGFRFIGGIG